MLLTSKAPGTCDKCCTLVICLFACVLYVFFRVHVCHFRYTVRKMVRSSEKWYARTKNDTALQTVCCSTFYGFSYVFPRKTVRRTFMWYTAYAFKTDGRTVSNGTLYAFWYAVRFSVAVVVPFIAADKVYKSYTCSIFGTGGCFWYAVLYIVCVRLMVRSTVFGTRVLYLVVRPFFGTRTVFGT